MPPRPAHARSRAGFSLIEATVVLAVAGMALMLIFATATRASQQGFRLGRLALDTVDAELAEQGFRDLVAGVEIAPWPPAPAASATLRFEGGPDGFQGPAVLGRGGPCGPAGPAGLVRVQIRRSADADRVICTVGSRTALLMEVKGRVAFAYSEDGRRWVPRWTDRPATGRTARPAERQSSRRLLVRLAALDGGFEVTAATERRRPPARGAATLPGIQL